MFCVTTSEILALIFGTVGALTGIAGMVSAFLGNQRASVANEKAHDANSIALRSLALQRGLADDTWEITDGYDPGGFCLYNKSVETANDVIVEFQEEFSGELIAYTEFSDVQPHTPTRFSFPEFEHADGEEHEPVRVRVSWVTEDDVKLVTALNHQPRTWS